MLPQVKNSITHLSIWIWIRCRACVWYSQYGHFLWLSTLCLAAIWLFKLPFELVENVQNWHIKVISSNLCAELIWSFKLDLLKHSFPQIWQVFFWWFRTLCLLTLDGKQGNVLMGIDNCSGESRSVRWTRTAISVPISISKKYTWFPFRKNNI